MDKLTGWWAQLLAATGLAGNPEMALAAALVLLVIIVAVALAFGRRSNRLEQRFAAPALLHSDGPTIDIPASATPETAANGPSSAGTAVQRPAKANPPTPDPASETASLSTDLSDLREGMASLLPNTKREFIAVQESVQHYQQRIELLRTTLNSLQSEQLTLHKLLQGCSADLKGIEQFAASVPKLREEHASIKQQLAELNARFEVVSEVLADFLPADDRPHER